MLCFQYFAISWNKDCNLNVTSFFTGLITMFQENVLFDKSKAN